MNAYARRFLSRFVESRASVREGESWFSSCPRDEEGRCEKKGASSAVAGAAKKMFPRLSDREEAMYLKGGVAGTGLAGLWLGNMARKATEQSQGVRAPLAARIGIPLAGALGGAAGAYMGNKLRKRISRYVDPRPSAPKKNAAPNEEKETPEGIAERLQQDKERRSPEYAADLKRRAAVQDKENRDFDNKQRRLKYARAKSQARLQPYTDLQQRAQALDARSKAELGRVRDEIRTVRGEIKAVKAKRNKQP